MLTLKNPHNTVASEISEFHDSSREHSNYPTVAKLYVKSDTGLLVHPARKKICEMLQPVAVHSARIIDSDVNIAVGPVPEVGNRTYQENPDGKSK
jgi:hypothetical protein